ncbi:MAG: hypothetical protein EXS08_10735 [Planctomycetes bacterium]|nr:hypothetical protein [Planctomycetota bacterium]
MRPLALPCLLLVLLPACGESAPPPSAARWLDLSRGFRPQPLEELARRSEARVQRPRPGEFVHRGPAGEELWFELPLPREQWRAGQPGEWLGPMPSGGALLAGRLESPVLLDDGHELRRAAPREMKAGCFRLGGPDFLLELELGREPTAITCRVRLDHGAEHDGRWRVAQWDLASDGFFVFPGQAERLRCQVPEASALYFTSVSPDPGGRGNELGPTTFRVMLDGRSVFEEAQAYARPTRGVARCVPLPPGAHELAFEVAGDGPALVARPVLGPAEIGAPGARPWGAAQPDLVLVLCDTFRADNLAAWGGAPELAPQLNAFVERSLRFLDARSTAAWTLPSIGSILSGVFPGQHGGTDIDHAVSQGVETLAEVLGAAGYRTVALTDSGFCSRHYGQDQGFQWFEEALVTTWNLERSLARARAQLAADDGRPLFLLVHTYRVHGPMRSGPEEDPRPWMEVQAEVHKRALERKAQGVRRSASELTLEFADVGLRFYHDAVLDLDRKVGAFEGELERARFFEHGVLVLTSDHGNAYGEHQSVGHGGDLYDEKLRVPLALRGPGLEPRAVPGVVSLIDLAPTLAELARVAPSPTWPGRSLLDASAPRPSYAFDLKKRNRQVALFHEGKKLMAPDIEALRAGKPTHAFDLATDPRELDDLSQRLNWPAELGRTFAGALEPLLVPAEEGGALELPPEILQQLQDIGYAE